MSFIQTNAQSEADMHHAAGSALGHLAAARSDREMVAAYMGHIQAAAERKKRAALARLPDGRHAFTDHVPARRDGTSEELAGQAQFTARAGDVLSVETPGGGGFGSGAPVEGVERDDPHDCRRSR
jgi:N-methylhydantoinase B/oxoprolinase/acetone carboxylase alpha subunit